MHKKQIMAYALLLLYLWFLDPAILVLKSNFSLFLSGFSGRFMTRPIIVMICWAISVLGLGAILLSKNKALKTTAWILFTLSNLCNWTAFSLTQAPLNLHQYELIFSEMGNNTGSFFITNRTAILTALFTSLGSSLGLYACFRFLKAPPLRHTKILYLLTLVAVAINVIRFKTIELVIPSPFAVPSVILYKHFSHHYYGPRDTLTIFPETLAHVDNVIFIMDETVRDDYMSINNPDMDTTPYLQTVPLVNYGRGLSIANSSRHSNTAVRTGLRPDQMPDTTYVAFKKPNLFQFAKNAGFQTHYANAQMDGTTLDNMMNKFDLPFMDTFKNVRSVPDKVCGDQAVADFILKYAKKGTKNFFYVNKAGNHFPYAHQYPETETIYSPAHKKGEEQTDPIKTINAYKNSMRWTVDRFFAYLLPKLKGTNFLIVYVSDHGENIANARCNSGHCSLINASPDETRVAFFTFSDDPKVLKLLAQAQPLKHNKATQFDVFPTLLWSMGYGKDWVKKTFGPGLLDSENYPQQFFVGSIQHSGFWQQVS